jgi:hypothetical protein
MDNDEVVLHAIPIRISLLQFLCNSFEDVSNLQEAIFSIEFDPHYVCNDVSYSRSGVTNRTSETPEIGE